MFYVDMETSFYINVESMFTSTEKNCIRRRKYFYNVGIKKTHVGISFFYVDVKLKCFCTSTSLAQGPADKAEVICQPEQLFLHFALEVKTVRKRN